MVEVNATERNLTKREKSTRSSLDAFRQVYDRNFPKKKDQLPGVANDDPMVLMDRALGRLRLYLDPKTLLPISFDSAQEKRTYSFSANPPPLAPPEGFKPLTIAGARKWRLYLAALPIHYEALSLKVIIRASCTSADRSIRGHLRELGLHVIVPTVSPLNRGRQQHQWASRDGSAEICSQNSRRLHRCVEASCSN